MIDFMSHVVNLLVVMAGLSIIPAFIWVSRCVPPTPEPVNAQEEVERRIAQLESRADRSYWP